MIFGFNTDVRHGDTVYHVQSEARASDRVLETQVFVRGRCAGKHIAPFGDQPESDQQIHEHLQAQHRRVVEAIRAGTLDDLLRPKPAPALKLDWLSANPAENSILLRFRLTTADGPVAGARVLARLDAADKPGPYAESSTAADGTVEIRLPFDPAAAAASVTVGAAHAGASLTQRFRLRRR